MTERKKSLEERIIALAKLGMRPALIAVQVNRKPDTVYHYVNKARRAGVNIPKFETGPITARQSTTVSISPEATSRLRPMAHRRGLGVRELAAELIEVIARDALVAAILDDGAQNNG